MILRFSIYDICHKSASIRKLGQDAKALSTIAPSVTKVKDTDQVDKEKEEESAYSESFANYRYSYPEFLPDPNPLFRNSLRERIERLDMLARRSVLAIPEFYVGSIVAVNYSEPHASGKESRFVGICILREGCGLRASFILRNVINTEAMEMCFNLYDPTIQKMECLKLEKRLDDQLLYLRDAPLEYSTFPFDMEPQVTGSVTLNEMKVPLNPLPWSQKWELQNLKGVTEFTVSRKRTKKMLAFAKPWEKYDLMKMYRSTIPQEEQQAIFSDVRVELRRLKIKEQILRRKLLLQNQKKPTQRN